MPNCKYYTPEGTCTFDNQPCSKPFATCVQQYLDTPDMKRTPIPSEQGRAEMQNLRDGVCPKCGGNVENVPPKFKDLYVNVTTKIPFAMVTKYCPKCNLILTTRKEDIPHALI